jgi:hypothetical protein
LNQKLMGQMRPSPMLTNTEKMGESAQRRAQMFLGKAYGKNCPADTTAGRNRNWSNTWS